VLEIVSVNFSHTLFFVLDFLAFEDGADGSSQNVGKEIPVSAA
jgi:hypothetical protein